MVAQTSTALMKMEGYAPALGFTLDELLTSLKN